jgi:hypothetical protein
LNRPLPNSYWVIPGLLLAGEYPIGSDYSDARARLARFREARINSFIDLTEKGELPEYRHLLQAHTQYKNSPIADTSVPNSTAQIRELLSDIRAAIETRRRLYVHCRAGIGRTGLVMGCYLAEEASDGKAALKQLNLLWTQSERAQSWPKIPQTKEQADYIRRWTAIRN